MGARLLAFDAQNAPIRIENAAYTVAQSLDMALAPGVPLQEKDMEQFARSLAGALMSSALGEELSGLTKELMLTPPLSRAPGTDCLFTFSGGVSEYLFDRETHVFNDMANYLTEAIRSEFQQRGLTITRAGEGIRATAIGASQFTVQLSGNTILVSDEITLPLHNMPVVCPKLTDKPTRDQVKQGIVAALMRLDMHELESPICIYLPWQGDAEYPVLFALASGVYDAMQERLRGKGLPLVLALDVDLGAALGRILKEELGFGAPLISIDGVELRELDFIDLGEPLEPTKVLPVMVKSLAFPTPEI